MLHRREPEHRPSIARLRQAAIAIDPAPRIVQRPSVHDPFIVHIVERIEPHHELDLVPAIDEHRADQQREPEAVPASPREHVGQRERGRIVPEPARRQHTLHPHRRIERMLGQPLAHQRPRRPRTLHRILGTADHCESQKWIAAQAAMMPRGRRRSRAVRSRMPQVSEPGGQAGHTTTPPFSLHSCCPRATRSRTVGRGCCASAVLMVSVPL